MKKLLVTEVVTMAHNDHRITAENDELKLELTVKNTIHPDHSLMEIKKGDDLEEIFGGGGDAMLVERNESLKNRVDELTGYLNASETTINSLKSEKSTLETDKSTLQSEVLSLKAEIENLKLDAKTAGEGL